MKLPAESNWKEITRNSYDQHADQFASFASTYRGKMQRWTEDFSRQFPKNSSILDVGCGAGRDALYLTEKGLLVTGIDFSKKLIEIVKKKVPNGKFFVMDFENLSLPQNSFEGAWANASLYHLPRTNLLKVFEQIREILKERGLFLSTYRVGEGERFTKEKRGDAILERFAVYYQPEEIKEMLTKAGFKDIEFELDHIETGDWMRFLARK